MVKTKLLFFILGLVISFSCPCFAGIEGRDFNRFGELPEGPGQVCIKYATGYTSLLDWRDGPSEMPRYVYISYDSIDFFQDVNSCVGNKAFPGALQEGVFLLLLGGMLNQAALVKIERIPATCPYKLTYYWLTNPRAVSGVNGTCQKSTSEKPKNGGPPNTCGS